MSESVTRASLPTTANMVWFLILFLIPAFMSYLSGPLLGAAVIDQATADDAMVIRNVYLGICYAIIFAACLIRGRATGRIWMIVFPIVAAMFDMLLPLPFVPTVMFILIMVVGLREQRLA